VLALVNRSVPRISVGKRKGWGTSQAEIHELLVDEARAGAHVVRLKGGDPFVFGRGGEEVAALHAAGVPVSVIPGVSSALAAPTLAGIPVTHRNLADTVTVITGHRAGQGPEDDDRWSHVAAIGGTVVVLMGASTAAAVAWRLLRGGRRYDEPAAVIRSAGTSEQTVVRCRLGDLAADGSPLAAPSVLVIGPTAAEGVLDGVHREAVSV
jgi:uroporphyrin-III C-methyltransferase